MKKEILFIILAVVCASVGCSKMNDNIDQYLSQGEIVYIARPDSVHLFAGKERFKVEFWLRDPRAKELRVYWSQRADSTVIAFPKERDMDEPIVAIVDKNVYEGSYTLNLVSYDSYGNKSVTDEENVNVYGTNFSNSLNNRLIDKVALSGDKLTITWGNCYSTKEVGIKVYYTDKTGKDCEVLFPTADTADPTVITNLDSTKPVKYSTVYIPEVDAIDIFETATAAVEF